MASTSTIGTLYEISSGKLFIDQFNSLSSRWTASPKANISITSNPGKVTLTSTNVDDTLLLTSILEGDFAFEVFADYTPLRVGDEAGIVIWTSATDKIEFVERVDDTRTSTEVHWMVARTDGVWSLYSDSGSGYVLVDTAEFEGLKIGLVHKSAYITTEPLIVDFAVATKGNILIVHNLHENYTVNVLDHTGLLLSSATVMSGYTAASVLLPYLEVEGTLQVLDPGGNILHSTEGMFYGGDVYSVGSSLQVHYKGKELGKTSQTSLGSLATGGVMWSQLELYNPLDVKASAINISVVPYMNETAWELADAAWDVGGSAGPYSPVIYLGELGPNQTAYFWVRLSNFTGTVTDEGKNYQFSISLTHD